jgi:transcriptional regulator with XRE-family HTH domain
MFMPKQQLKIGDRLREARTSVEPELAQSELSRRLGLSRTAVAMYETNRSVPSAETLAKLAMTLQRSSDWFLGLSDDPTPAAQRSRLDVPVFLCPLLSSTDIKNPEAWRGRKALGWIQMEYAWPVAQAAALRMPDDTMEPSIRSGALVICARVVLHGEDEGGQPAIVLADVGAGAPVLRRLLRDGPHMWLAAERQGLPLRAVDKHVKVIARAVEVCERKTLFEPPPGVKLLRSGP